MHRDAEKWRAEQSLTVFVLGAVVPCIPRCEMHISKKKSEMQEGHIPMAPWKMRGDVWSTREENGGIQYVDS